MFGKSMSKEEHQKMDRIIPKCSCGNNLSRQRQEENIDHCPACDFKSMSALDDIKARICELCDTDIDKLFEWLQKYNR